jgi:sterol desaturase/sphingolipid hydroxylase (fatty acid hydroxylase superfamily)
MKSRQASAALMIGGIAALLLLERLRALRHTVEPGPARVARNLAIAALTAATVAAAERPIVTHLSRLTATRTWGIAPRLPLPPALQRAAAIILMDYTLYWWHVLLHRVPLLWRTHEPHHIDRDLDASTGVRFHFTEFLASIPWRCAQIVVIGVAPRTLALWQRLTLAEVLFHHSNLRLPLALERWLAHLVVTPRMHGTHHSVERPERDSNFSSGLSLWDRVHDTSWPDLRHDDVVIGMPTHQRPRDVSLGKTLALPFKSPQPDRRRAIRRRVPAA